jgi:hypothetical protein
MMIPRVTTYPLLAEKGALPFYLAKVRGVGK